MIATSEKDVQRHLKKIVQRYPPFAHPQNHSKLNQLKTEQACLATEAKAN